MRVVLATVIMIARIGHAEPADSFKPPCAVAEAQDRFERGKKLFEAKQYADAAIEFAAAFDLDRHAKFLLFNLALSRRMAGACKDAIDAYRAFLDAGPPDAFAKNARIGIERCEKTLTSEPPVDKPPEKPPEKPPDTPINKPPEKAPDTPVIDAHVVDKVGAGSRTDETPWYRDALGVSLVGGGAACAIAGATLYFLARSDADATFAPSSVAGFLDDRHAAARLQTASWIVTGVGAALAIGGAIRFGTRARHRSVAVVPAAHPGAALVLEGRF